MDAKEAPTRLRDLRNLGPSSERSLTRVGIRTPEDLDEIGAAEAFRRLAEAGTPNLTRVFLWALAGALLDLDWRELPASEKDALLRQAGLAG